MRRILLSLVLVCLLALGSCSFGPKVVEFDRSVYRFYVQGKTATVFFWGYNSIEWAEAFEIVERMGVKHLKIDIRNPGGAVIDMVHILETLTRFKANGGKIHTHVSGWAASAAVPIWLMGDYRTIDNNAFVMMHPHSGWNKLHNDYQYQAAFPEECPSHAGLEKIYHLWNVVYCEVVEDASGMTYDECMVIMEPEKWDTNSGMYFYTAQEMLELGFAHFVTGKK